MLLVEPLEVGETDILEWKKKSVRAVLESSAAGRISKLVDWARYAQIPLCNLAGGGEMLTEITNIQLGRLLRAGDQLTWWNAFNRDLTTTYESEAFTGKINNPGVYSHYCIEVAMENLAVNTVVLAD